MGAFLYLRDGFSFLPLEGDAALDRRRAAAERVTPLGASPRGVAYSQLLSKDESATVWTNLPSLERFLCVGMFQTVDVGNSNYLNRDCRRESDRNSFGQSGGENSSGSEV